MIVVLSAQTFNAEAICLLLDIKERLYLIRSGTMSLRSSFYFPCPIPDIGFSSSLPLFFSFDLLAVPLFLYPGDRNLPEVRTPIATRTLAAIVEGGAVSGEMGSKLVRVRVHLRP